MAECSLNNYNKPFNQMALPGAAHHRATPGIKEKGIVIKPCAIPVFVLRGVKEPLLQ